MLKVSEDLYTSFDVADFYAFVFRLLEEKARHPDYRAALDDRARCRRLWEGMYDPQADQMELALRHAHALGAALRGETGPPPGEDTSRMKTDLDNWGFFAFSAFDEDEL
ncbi:hypothetical protein [Erythrobacter donghaensis]|uniref:hypothetical protein n=1 Tax=Erythrobacter donghaensis TaxID=267135 RepID=UPI000A3941DF|nr:hypothetical protein [Erythrobacter donghaensis]